MRTQALGICVAGALLHCLCISAAAAEVSVAVIISNTLARSRTLLAARYEVDIARAVAGQAGAAALPSVDLRGSAARYSGLTDSSLGALTLPAIEDRYSISAGVSQPLFTGGKIMKLRRAARLSGDAAESRLEETESDVVLQAVAAYWNWSKAVHSTAALGTAVARMEAHSADTRNLLAAGMATENDSLAADVLLEQTRLRLQESIDAARTAKVRLRFITGMELAGDDTPVKPAKLAGQQLLEAETMIAQALGNRAAPQAAKLEADAATARAAAARADFYPQVQLGARYEQSQPNPLFFPPAEEVNDDYFAGVTATWSLIDWGMTRNKAREAAARQQQAALRYQDAVERVRLDVEEARIAMENAVEREKVADRAEQSATRNLQLVENMWTNGLARHSEVLDAQSRMTDAQYQLVSARADGCLADAALRHAVGRPMIEATRP